MSTNHCCIVGKQHIRKQSHPQRLHQIFTTHNYILQCIVCGGKMSREHFNATIGDIYNKQFAEPYCLHYYGPDPYIRFDEYYKRQKLFVIYLSNQSEFGNCI